ncbi:MAG: hypothetical protein GX220_06175 [Treponema sp.]|jgi:hypothetical protein|nr:hypothetical protein [Treponema sp.]
MAPCKEAIYRLQWGNSPESEAWMKHFITQRMANGMIGLLLMGGLLSCAPILTPPVEGDGGVKEVNISLMQEGEIIRNLYEFNNILYMTKENRSTKANSFLKSYDYAETWQEYIPSVTLNKNIVTANNKLYSATETHIYSSTDGISWEQKCTLSNIVSDERQIIATKNIVIMKYREKLFILNSEETGFIEMPILDDVLYNIAIEQNNFFVITVKCTKVYKYKMGESTT